MSLPAPAVGLVIRYSFLWSHEADAGADEGAKDRPAAIVLSSRAKPDGDVRVVVVPVTHLEPEDLSTATELPQPVCRKLGLDAGRHWLKVEELNRFTWPGFDLRPIPASGAYAYGMLPRDIFEQLRALVLALDRARKTKVQDRD